MSARSLAFTVALVAIALVLAQVVAPGAAFYHTWQYALALALALAVIVPYAKGAWRGGDGVAGKRLAVAFAGAAIVDIAGLASGLLGPDTASVVGTPGTVAPIPALGTAAFFAPADAAAIARNGADVALRRRGGGEIPLRGNARRVLGESVVYRVPRPAAYVEATDGRGGHLTITQPTNPSFLSPVLLFRDRQRVGPLSVPFDTFATPAQHRVFRALYFTPEDLARFRHAAADVRAPSVVLTAADDAGRPLGITLAASGRDVEVGGVRVRLTLGSYPALGIASAPEPWALAAGLLVFLGGLAWAATALRRPHESTAKTTVSGRVLRRG